MDWPLHTTGADDPYAVIGGVLDGDRKFLWLHFETEDEVTTWADQCREAGLVVLDEVPCWFVLACSKSVPRRDRVRMMESITVNAGNDCQWRGEMFGYYPEDIDWYKKEIVTAMDRIIEYKRRKR